MKPAPVAQGSAGDEGGAATQGGLGDQMSAGDEGSAGDQGISDDEGSTATQGSMGDQLTSGCADGPAESNADRPADSGVVDPSAVLTSALESLGQAHHRPYSRI